MAKLPRCFFLLFHCLFFSLAGVWAPPAMGHGDYHEVVAEIGRALEADPDNADLHFRLAVACQEHGDWTSAIVELERAERLAPGKHPVALVQGLALAQGGLAQAAESALTDFLRTHPHHTQALTARARVRLVLHRPQDAAADFRAALAAPALPDPEVVLEASKTLDLLGRGEDAATVLDQGISRLGPHPELLERAIHTALAGGHLQTALQHLDSLREASEQPEEALASKARLLAKAGLGEASLSVWRDLRGHLLAMPNLQRGLPHHARLLNEAQMALGDRPAPAAVHAPPAGVVLPAIVP